MQIILAAPTKATQKHTPRPAAKATASVPSTQTPVEAPNSSDETYSTFTDSHDAFSFFEWYIILTPIGNVYSVRIRFVLDQ